MAANTSPVFPIVPNIGFGRTSAANTARDGSGSLVTIFTAGTNGSRVDEIKFTSAQASNAASSATAFRVFVTDNAGANPRLLVELAIPAVTPTSVAIGSFGVIDFINGISIAYLAASTITTTNHQIIGGFQLASGQLIKICQATYAGAQDQFDVIAKGGDY